MAVVPQNWAATEENQSVPTPRPHRLPGWEGRSTIAYVNNDSVKRFYSLPAEAHARLQAAAAQLVAENSITQRILKEHGNTSIDVSSLSAVERYELARYQVDHPPEAPAPQTNARPKAPRLRNDYTHHLVSYIPHWKASTSRLLTIEDFRVKLTGVVDAATKGVLQDLGLAHISPLCVGSYLSGFALTDSNLDLLMNTSEIPASVRVKLATHLVRALLKADFCAALTTDPQCNSSTILKVSEKSSPEFLETLRRKASDANADVQFPESLGIRCHIHFQAQDTMYHSSDLVRCYHLCDNRVVAMVFFIKKWINARRINKPEDGMLSTYGYMVMLLHYLLHVAYPAVVPNLQQRKSSNELYWSNRKEITTQKNAGNLTKNQDSTETLIRGFFAYYSSQPIVIHRGPSRIHPFVFKHNVVSLGVNPCAKKTSKDWQRPYRFENGRKVWYYLAIEDPFDRNHNVAEHVNPAGANIIRDEFSRAYKILTRTQLIPGTGWQWRTDDGKIGDELLDIRNPTSAELDGLVQPKMVHNPRQNAPVRTRQNSGLNGPFIKRRYAQTVPQKEEKDVGTTGDNGANIVKPSPWMKDVQEPHDAKW